MHATVYSCPGLLKGGAILPFSWCVPFLSFMGVHLYSEERAAYFGVLLLQCFQDHEVVDRIQEGCPVHHEPLFKGKGLCEEG
eukprot:1161813-Pelagomonas_calceolata.AAC.8